ncbi:hypothetical protein [Streptomyces xantholiticus]|uniref:hypothetical protein n=1 Tax=Streptomyces xantholiticus TaxID=68285 RepID=UPI00167B94B3|nr:hypothetical protein [Streptomyces xantholiticus]GGW29434.1 hypothetical protein GCM10010381_12530 [Streptomyces xantholiticus]
MRPERMTLAQYPVVPRQRWCCWSRCTRGDPPPGLEQLSIPVVASGRRSAQQTVAAVDSYDFEGARVAVARPTARG